MFRKLSLFIGLVLTLPAIQLQAADQNPAETRLREGLKNTMLQLRDAQTQLSAAQATQADSDQKIKDLEDKVAKLEKQSVNDKEASDKAIADLNAKLTASDAEVMRLNKSLVEWKDSQKKASELAATKESQRAKLEAEAILLRRRVSEQQTKNDAMFKLGKEILVRYEKFGIGDALTAREPFVGITRVKFENLMQDYQDKLVNQQIKPAEQKAPDKKPAGAKSQAAKPD